MSNEERRAINRANASKSTGPKSDAGKQRSSLNATRHGMTGQVVVLPAEDLKAYTKHLESFQTALGTKGAVEIALAQIAAECTWKMSRGSAYETNLITIAAQFEGNRIDTGIDQVQDAFAYAQAATHHARAIANMSVYQARTARILQSTLGQLQAMQTERRERERHDMAEAVRMLRHHKREDPRNPYNPRRDGFVFTAPEVELQLRRQDRHYEALPSNYSRFVDTKTA